MWTICWNIGSAEGQKGGHVKICIGTRIKGGIKYKGTEAMVEIQEQLSDL